MTKLIVTLPGLRPFTATLVGCSPVQLGMIMVRTACGKTIPVKACYLKEAK